ncbi:MAG TPA: sigma-70 family RNA polymerase sigma factor [Planctomycetota bacterium]|nr:sigma-70 family RNA polymerase sigma factor [Planctomycetota bacterium]
MDAKASSTELSAPLKLSTPLLPVLDGFQAELEHRFPRLVLICRFMARNPDHADDLAQEVIVAALKYRASYNPAYDLGAWLGGIARNLAKRRNYDPRTVPLFDAMADELELGSADGADDSESFAGEYEVELGALRECVSETSPTNRRLIEMRYTEGMRSAAIAEKLAIQEDAVRARLMRIRRALGRCIRKKTKNR